METSATESSPVRRRLTADARRKEIIDVVQGIIAAEGAPSLSLRGLARRCGMSAPGLMHYFPDLKSLLEAVLLDREQRDLAAIMAKVGPGPTLASVLDAAVRYFADQGEVTRHFDALEAEARNPEHPAHEYFAGRSRRTLDELRPLIDRDYEHPEQVAAVVEVLYDGVRSRWVMHPERSDLWADWSLVRDSVFQTFVEKPRPE